MTKTILEELDERIEEYQYRLMIEKSDMDCWEELEKWYHNDFPDSDNHGDTAYIANMMGRIEELQDLKKLLGANKDE
jgi:hypothetical protein